MCRRSTGERREAPLRESDAWFDPIYTANYSRLVKVAYYLLWDKSMVEDIVQSAFFALLLKREALRDHPNIPGWLTETVRNLANNEHSRARYTREVPLTPGRDVAAGEPPPDFMSLLPAGLNESERTILYLSIEAGLSHEEIAARLGCRPEASRMRLSRARQRCRALLLEKKA